MDQSSDNYQYEEEQERLAMLKNIYLPMKTWFTSLDPNFTAKFDKFPLFWRDLESWSSYKDVKKLYLAASEKLEAGEKVDIVELEKKIFERNNPTLTQPIATEETKDGDAEERKRKRRQNRWGNAPSTESEFTPINPAETPSLDALVSLSNNSEQTGDDATKKARKSRWSTAPVPATSSAVSLVQQPIQPIPTFTLTPEIMQQTLVLQMQLKQLNDKLLTVVQDAMLEEMNPNRPPSPPPKYDAHGKRLNTREVRMKEALSIQRTAVIEQMMKINPLFQPPADFVKQKPFRRLFIPFKTHPNYNFIGLIIGPRGNTQKRMERETGCKISIRGRGSVKEGSKGRAAKNNPDDDEELHVHVQGETEDAVERAAKMVAELLVPVDDDKNEHKQKQLRELALINGTLREEEYCTICGDKGHRHFECPQRTKTFQAANVRCAICGDQSHPTRDCPQKQDGPTNEIALDTEYMSFMAELGDDGQRKDVPEVDPAMSAITGGVKVEKKGHQTVIKVQTVMTGLPPVAPMAPTSYAAPMPWMPATTPPAATGYESHFGAAQAPVSNAASWGYPAGYYYPTSTYPDATQQTAAMMPTAPTDPAAAYGQQAAQGQYDYAQYQQYYAQWYQQQAAAQQAPPPPPPPPPPPQDTDMSMY